MMIPKIYFEHSPFYSFKKTEKAYIWRKEATNEELKNCVIWEMDFLSIPLKAMGWSYSCIYIEDQFVKFTKLPQILVHFKNPAPTLVAFNGLIHGG